MPPPAGYQGRVRKKPPPPKRRTSTMMRRRVLVDMGHLVRREGCHARGSGIACTGRKLASPVPVDR
jgi:hypothetical protein